MRRVRRWHLLVLTGLLFASLLGFSIFQLMANVTAKTQAAAVQTRNPLTWPFAVNSIWNMPIGSNAKYVNATIGSRGFATDIDWFITTKASDPLVPMYMPAAWGQGRCGGTTPQQQAQWHPEAAQPIHVPTDLIIPDAITSGGIYWTPNSSSAFLQPDGKTLVSFNVTARCQVGGPLYGNWFGQQDLYGDGIGGGHGGSALSSIGGSIRAGELLSDQPLRHALKVDIWGNWMHYDTTSGGHRWPAPLADGGAPQQYKGINPALVMGSLLALPPDATPESLGVTSALGKKVFYAFQNYGAYVVDDTGGDYNALCVEQTADVEFKQVMGHSIDKDQSLMADFNKMIAVVKVIDNNSPTTIGGGGTPRVPLAPQFGAPIVQPPLVATAQPTLQPTATKVMSTPTVTPTGKTLVSSTLKSNNSSTSRDERPLMANYDGVGNSYSEQALQKAGLSLGKTVTIDGVKLTWPTSKAGDVDNYQSGLMAPSRPGIKVGGTLLTGNSSTDQQPVMLHVSPVKGAKKLAFLGAATHGPSQGQIVITYSDGSQQAAKIGFSDWTLNGGKTAAPMFHNRIAFSMPYRNSTYRHEGREQIKTYLFLCEVDLEVGKTISSVMLPETSSHGHLHIFALGTGGSL